MRVFASCAMVVALWGCRDDAAATGDDGQPDARPIGPPDPCIAANTCPAGTWVNVTPPGAMVPEFGLGPVVVDPARPSDLYLAGGGNGVWKSSDYGNTWAQINTDIGYVPMGLVIAVAGTTPATVMISSYKKMFKSVDGGVTYAELPNDLTSELYSITIDPHDNMHLISGLHEADGVVESTDGGVTWNAVSGTGFPTGGISWYPFFIDTGTSASTRTTWIAIAQNGGSVVTTHDSGAHWAIPNGISGLNHAHGNAQVFQNGDIMIVPGTGGPDGQGLYRSDDRGATFRKIQDGAYSVAWGTSAHVYAMWGWACANCDLGAAFSVADLPTADTWTKPDVPAALNIGLNHIAVTSDGTHTVFVGDAWSTGLWRYVEP